jgi:hypothetical protein
MRSSRLIPALADLGLLLLIGILLVSAARGQQVPALVDASTGEVKRPTPAQLRSANDLAQASTHSTTAAINGWFADPSTNASFAAAAWRSDLGLVIGTNVQAYDAALAALAGGSDFVQFTGPTTTAKVFTLPDASSTLLYSGGPLGTPSGGTLTNATGLPISTGISGLGTGVATALAAAANAAAGFVTGAGSATLTNKSIDAAQLTGSVANARLDAELQALAGLTSAADKLPYFTGSGTASVADFTAAGRAILDDADASAQRTTLGLGTIATQSASSVAITGGTVNGAPIGASTPSSGAFTTLTANNNFTVTGGTAHMIELGASGTFTLSRAGLATAVVDFVGARANLSLSANGLLVARDVTTDATTKNFRLGLNHYTNSEEPLGLIFGTSSSTGGEVAIGGGTALFNAATAIQFWAAANNTTTNGTLIGTINSTGLSVATATESTSTTTGSGIFSGGVGIAKNLHVGGGLTVAGTGNFSQNIHATRQDGSQADITATTYGVDGGGILHGRLANGTIASPSGVLSGQIVGGVGGRAYHSGGAFQASSPASIHFVASENQTATNYGSYLRFLTTPQGSTTRQERVVISDNGTLWAHNTGTFDPRVTTQTKPVSDLLILASADGAISNPAIGAFGYGGSTAGFRAGSSNGTPASPSATPSGRIISFLAGHVHDGSSWTTGAQGLFYFTTTETASGSARGVNAVVAVTPTGSTTRSDVATFSSTGLSLTGAISPSGSSVTWTAGSGSPEGVVTAVVGSLYSRTDGGAGTALYVKESGSGNTGWAAK